MKDILFILLTSLIGLAPLIIAWVVLPFEVLRDRWKSPEKRTALEQHLVMRSRKRQVMRRLHQVSRNQRR